MKNQNQSPSEQVQFVLVMVHAFQLLFRNDCNYPIYFAYFIGAHAVLFYFLFSQFYKQAYTQKQKVGVFRRTHMQIANPFIRNFIELTFLFIIKYIWTRVFDYLFSSSSFSCFSLFFMFLVFFFSFSFRVVLPYGLTQRIESDRIANSKKNDDADADADSKREAMKFINGQTNIYKSKIDPTATRTRHYVGSAN